MKTSVIRSNDDGECPLVGTVYGWLDDDRCLVAWGAERFSEDPRLWVEWMDELLPR